MPRYVALLGSINVGGNRLKMDELRVALEDEGFVNVQTVVASGNVLFGIDSFAAVRGRAELASAVDDNPFVKDGEAKFVHTVFLSDELDRGAFEAFAKAYDGPERLAPGKREFFVDFVDGVARSKLDPAMKKAKVVKGRATARNIRSIGRMLEKMDAGA